MTDVHVELVRGEVHTLGPGDVVLVTLPEHLMDDAELVAAQLRDTLGDDVRFLIAGDDVGFTVVHEATP